MKYISLVLALILILALPIHVMAIANPDTPPEANAVYVYGDLLEKGDAGVLIDCYLDYAVTPNETATQSFMGIFIDTDGTTQLKAVAPYTFVDSGYGRGLIWIYFTAAEVTAYSIDRADEALYRVWLIGNPTLSWPGDPPKTIATIDYWQPADSDASVLVALRVLYYADVLELIWLEDMIEETPLGNRLTDTGASYFLNVIPNLMLIAPSAFASGEYEPTLEDIDYSTEFGAIIRNGTGNVTGSPVTLAEGTNTVTANATGTLILELNKGVVGTVTNNGGTVTGSPVAIVAGTNTITVTGTGTLTIVVELENLETGIIDAVTGTGLDLTAAATAFGMTRWMFSGIIWIILGVVVCAAVYRARASEDAYTGGAGKTVLLVFDIWIIGGTLLGLLHPIVAILMFLGFGGFTGYILFFRQANV